MNMKLCFSTLREANIARQAEWPGAENVDLAFRGLEVAGEAGELANKVKKMVRLLRGISGTSEARDDLLEAIAKEAADVVISVDLLCEDLGIDLGWAVVGKFDETSAKHGLKTLLGEDI